MDSDLAHESLSQVNGRKRKADGEEPKAPSAADSTPADAMMVDSATPPNPLSNAPRHTAFWPSRVSPATGGSVWSSADAPPVSPLTEVPEEAPRCQKRPRIEREQGPPSRPMKRLPKRQRSLGGTPPRTPSRPMSRTSWHQSDIRDMGITPTRDPGPITGSLYRVKGGPCAPDCNHHLLPSPLPPINLNSPHIPALLPLINTQTLRELDLNAILRNPQLRHDLLFDSGLQFRPTSGRRKRDLSDKYWSAVALELETDSSCTCISFDLQGKPNDSVCVCRRIPIPPPNPVLAFSTARKVLTLRMPSRIRPLLAEFLELLLCVIQPLSGISGCISPATVQSQMQQHATQASHLRSLFDADLIEQEIRHGVFDPSGLFRTIGNVLKSHCAPMRDRAVEAMVEVAQTCAPGGNGSSSDAVRAVRMCLDILELMKLDIANHQLQTLRPFLVETSGQFELKAFKRRKGHSVHLTKQWLQTAHRHLEASGPIPHPALPTSAISYTSLSRTHRAHLCALKGLSDVVFDPPTPIRISKASLPSPNQGGLPSATPLPGYPETTFLDSARLILLGTESADAVALYMFIMLYRQLVFSDTSSSSNSLRTMPKVTDDDLKQIKTEIKDIAACHLGYCFTRGASATSPPAASTSAVVADAETPVSTTDDKEWERWQKAARDVVLQIATRATQARNRPKNSTPTPSEHTSTLPDCPDDRMIKMAEGWLETNLRLGSPLSVLLRNRVRDAVFHRVIATTFPAQAAASGQPKPTSSPPPPGTVAGLECIGDEIQTISEKLSKLAHIHLGVYMPLYEQEGILQS